jgi:hypothetical protein
MPRPRHPDKHIEKAVRYAESVGWTVEISNGHAWGKLYCPFRSRGGCMVSVWSTPRNPENHARHIAREVDFCPHQEPIADERGDDNEHA